MERFKKFLMGRTCRTGRTGLTGLTWVAWIVGAAWGAIAVWVIC